MDALIRAAREHGQISERMTFFQKALPVISARKDYDQMTVVARFLNEYVVAHFHYEETEIFPALLARGGTDEKSFVRTLQLEHARILAEVEKFFLLIDETSPASGQEKFDELFAVAKEIITATLFHAKKEDESLFPVMKKYLPRQF